MSKLKTLLTLLMIWLVLVPPAADARRRRRRRRAVVRIYFNKGKRLFKTKDYVGALAAFERAYRLRPHYLVQCNIARCYERMSKMIESANHYRRCLKEGAGKARASKRVRAALAQVEARITWVEVVSPGMGGTVYVDGREVGTTPKRVPMNPGTAVIEVRREGAKAARTTITARGGEAKTVELVPEDLQPEVLPRPPPPVKPVVQVKKKEESKGLHQAWFWTSATVTVAMAVVASIFGVKAMNLKSDYEENPTRDGYNAAKDKRLIANIFWGATVAAGATSTLLFFYTDWSGMGKRSSSHSDDDDDEVSFVIGVRGTF